MKKYLFLSIALVLAILLSYGSIYINPVKQYEVNTIFANENALLKQRILSYTNEAYEAYKLYDGTNLVAVITDYNYINQKIDEEYHSRYESNFPNTSLGLGQGLRIVKEYVYYNVENIDDKIIEYLLKDDHLGVKATSIEFSTNEGVYDVIYVKNIDDYHAAQDLFLKNFLSEEAYNRFKRSEEAPEIANYGSIEAKVKILEKINSSEAIVSADKILLNQQDIYKYLCYGKNPSLQYYTVKAGDTLQGVGSLYNDMSPKQLLLINPDVLLSVDQVLAEGMQLNITYYQSPITVSVTKERLSKEIIYPDAPEYIEDPNMYANQKEVVSEEVNGYKNVLHEETWLNGVLQPKEVILSENVVEKPARAVIRVGTKPIPNVGTGNFVWPVDNPIITCRMFCYYGHLGTDIQNMYERYGPAHATDNGTVEMVGYDGIGGNWVIINHNNGLKSYYGHFNVPAFVEVGETVERGQIIGQIGRTGLATGPHVHWEIRDENNNRLNVCDFMDCDSIGAG